MFDRFRQRAPIVSALLEPVLLPTEVVARLFDEEEEE